MRRHQKFIDRPLFVCQLAHARPTTSPTNPCSQPARWRRPIRSSVVTVYAFRILSFGVEVFLFVYCCTYDNIAVAPAELLKRHSPDDMVAMFVANHKAWDRYNVRCPNPGE